MLFKPGTRFRNGLHANGSRAANGCHHRQGAVTIEMALVAPFIFLLVFASIEFARMMMIRQALTNASREGCRHACLASSIDDGDSVDLLRQRLAGVIRDHETTEALRIEIDPGPNVRPASGTVIRTTVEIDCADVSWFPPMFFGGSVIRSSSTMKRE